MIGPNGAIGALDVVGTTGSIGTIGMLKRNRMDERGLSPKGSARRALGARLAGGAALLNLSSRTTGARAQPTIPPHPELHEVVVGLERPWAIAFLPDGRRLITERPGRIRVLSAAGVLGEPLPGLPPIAQGGQGGLLDVVPSPDFARDQTIFLAFSQPADRGSRTAVARARLDSSALSDVRVVFAQRPSVESSHHFGARLVFGLDGNLFVTLGDRYSGAARAQDLGSHLGKIVRIRPDGSAPPDNPFVGQSDALPEIWSLGHRNVQGAVLHPETGQLWTHEHGAQGGDELNRVDAGLNYGWPIITHGVDYSGAKIGIGTQMTGMQQPVRYWVPSIAPSGMAFCTSSRYPKWRGSLFIGSLKFRCLVRLQFDGQRVVAEERLYETFGERIRDVRQGPDGYLYLLTDSENGRLLRVGA